MHKTPTRSDLNSSKLTPVKFINSPKTSTQNQTGIRPRLADIIKLLIENQKKWEAAQNRGLSLCKSIEALKSKGLESSSEPTSYPKGLKSFCDKLKCVFTIFEDVVENSRKSLKQIKALQNLCHNSEDVLFRTWNINHYYTFLKNIVSNYEHELEIKRSVLERIGHAGDRSQLIICTTVWEYPTHTDDEFLFKFELLKVETKLHLQ